MLRGLKNTGGRRLAPVGLALAAAAVFTAVALAAAGDLDATSFGTSGTGGKVVTSFGSSNDEANGMAIQQWDSRPFVVGYTDKGTSLDFAVARYNTNGMLDQGFGTGGKATTAFGSGDDVANAAVTQENHKLVAAGYAHIGSSDDFALARYNKNGTPDQPFGGGNSKLTTSIGAGDDRANAVTFQAISGESDFRLIAVGRSFNGSNDDFAVVRYKRTGTIDDSFSNDGKTTSALGPGNDEAFAVTLLPTNGKPMVAGRSWNGSDYDFALARYAAGGPLDTSFGGGDGFVTTAIGSGDDTARALLLQPDLRHVAAGYSWNGSSYDFAVVRYTNAGIPDASFGGGDGIVTTSIGSGDDQAYAVALQKDGKLVVAGRSSNGSDYDFAVVRYTAAGVPDTSFGGGDGIVTTPIGSGDDSAFALGILNKNGKPIAAGRSSNGSNFDFALTRYLP